MKKTILLLLLALSFASQAQDNAVPKPKYLNWGLSAGASATTFAMQLQASFTEPLQAQPGLGVELGGYMDYNLSRLWVMQFSFMLGCERVHLINGAIDDVLMPHTIDIAIKFGMRLPLGQWRLLLSAGPYSQFTFACPTFGPSHLENPFTRQINEDGDMAMNDFHSGGTVSAGFETPEGWQWMVNYSLCFTNLLNFSSPNTYLLPQKLSITLGKRF